MGLVFFFLDEKILYISIKVRILDTSLNAACAMTFSFAFPNFPTAVFIINKCKEHLSAELKMLVSACKSGQVSL